MAKLKTPLLSLEAKGPLGNALLFDTRQGQHRVRRKPPYLYSLTLAQQYQRWHYQSYTAWWHTLTNAQKRTWQIAAVRSNMPPFAYWMKDRLSDLEGVVGGWHLDEISAGKVADFTTNNNPGTVFGALCQPALIGHGLHFDGIDDKVTFGTDASLQLPAAFTFSLYLNPDNIAVGPTTGMGVMDYAANQMRVIIRRTDQIIRVRWRKADLAYTYYTLTTAITEDVYSHLAVTYDAAAGVLIGYLNGTPLQTNGVTISTELPAPRIGVAEGFGFFRGAQDEFTYLDRVLPQSEVNILVERRYP